VVLKGGEVFFGGDESPFFFFKIFLKPGDFGEKEKRMCVCKATKWVLKEKKPF